MKKVSKKREDFLWLGNATALDLVNTEIARAGERIDLLNEPDDYLRWLELAGFRLERIDRGKHAARGSELAKSYRAQMRRGFEHLDRGKTLPAELIKATNDFSDRGARRRLSIRDGKFMLEACWPMESEESYVAPVASAFAEFIVQADLTRVRKCKNPECILFFYDTSKSGTRAWCSLDICGNKMRMAAMRERRSSKR